jgi:hypothetical protein
MKKLLVLFFVLAMCWPCYGEVLVYKTKQKGNAFYFNNSLYTFGRYQEESGSGFVLLDVDIDSGRISRINSALWIRYFKATDSMDLFVLGDLDVYFGMGGKGTYMAISSFSVLDWMNDPNDYSEDYVYGATVTVDGMLRETSLIKGGAKVSIPVTLTGFANYHRLVATKPELGKWTIIEILDKKWTARANDLNDLGGEDAFLNTFLAIHSYLVAEGYPPLF